MNRLKNIYKGRPKILDPVTPTPTYPHVVPTMAMEDFLKGLRSFYTPIRFEDIVSPSPNPYLGVCLDK